MDDLVVFHRHPEGPVEMPVIRREQVDHVVVAHVRCSCGSQRAVVSRVATSERENGEREKVLPWPYRGSSPSGEVAS